VAFPAPPHVVLSDLDLKRDDVYVYWSSVVVPKLAVPEALTKLGAPEAAGWGYFRTLYARPASAAFSVVLCGRARKLDSRKGYSFVAAEYPEGELWGWIKEGMQDTPEADRRHDVSCSSPIRNAAPEDYRRPMDDTFKAIPLERRIHDGDELFFLRRSSGSSETLACQKVRIAKAARAPHLLAQYIREDGSIEETHFFARAGIRMGVGPDQLTPDGTQHSNSMGVGDHLRAVTEDGASIGFVRFGESVEEDKGVIRAYRPTSVQWWDRSAEKCAERLKSLNEAGEPPQAQP
jgi:hypothetical protein